MYEDLIGRETPLHLSKYDGSYHRRCPGRFVLHNAGMFLLRTLPGDLITRTPDPADDPQPKASRGGGDFILFDDRWFTVARGPRDGRTRYYVNIATPVEFDGESFRGVDLDLDVMWYTDEQPRVLDEDEFLAHSEAMRYPAPVIEHARAAVDEVLGLIGQRAFPFDRA